jgi:hypothetical protein
MRGKTSSGFEYVEVTSLAADFRVAAAAKDKSNGT